MCFNLPDPFFWQAVDVANLRESHWFAVVDSEAPLDDLSFSWRQMTEEVANVLPHHVFWDAELGRLNYGVCGDFLEPIKKNTITSEIIERGSITLKVPAMWHPDRPMAVLELISGFWRVLTCFATSRRWFQHVSPALLLSGHDLLECMTFVRPLLFSKVHIYSPETKPWHENDLWFLCLYASKVGSEYYDKQRWRIVLSHTGKRIIRDFRNMAFRIDCRIHQYA